MVVLTTAIASVLIGSATLTGIIYGVDKPAVGSGPGGNLVSPKFVANTKGPVGIIEHHAHIEFELALEEDETAALYTPSPSPFIPGTAISTLVVTEKDNTLPTRKTRTITYSGVYLMNVQGAKVENEAERMPFTCTFLVVTSRVVSAWA